MNHKFWNTQPVKHNITDNITDTITNTIRNEPYKLIDGFYWDIMNLDNDLELDDLDAQAYHLSYHSKGKLIGTLRIVDKKQKVAKIGRVAVKISLENGAIKRGAGASRSICALRGTRPVLCRNSDQVGAADDRALYRSLIARGKSSVRKYPRPQRAPH